VSELTVEVNRQTIRARKTNKVEAGANNR
jgi:hypothetical protein